MADLDRVASKHEAVDVSTAMAEAAKPADERISRPSNEHSVTTIAKRESVPREE